MQMVKLGKIIFKKLEDPDLDKLKVFCDSCKKLGYINNSNFKNIKLNQMRMPYGQFFIGVDTEKDIIFTFAGIHQLPEVAANAWRCLFRGAQLPGYALNAFSKNIFKTSLQISHILYYQILDITNRDPNAKIYISTNIIDNKDAPKSARLNRSTAPILEEQGILTLEIKDIELYYTRQNLWRVNIPKYMHQRSKIYLGL